MFNLMNDDFLKFAGEILKNSKDPIWKTVSEFKNIDIEEILEKFKKETAKNTEEVVQRVGTKLIIKVPGYSKEDLDVEISDKNIITIKGKSNEMSNSKSFVITYGIDENETIADVSLINGILYIILDTIKESTTKIKIN